MIYILCDNALQMHPFYKLANPVRDLVEREGVTCVGVETYTEMKFTSGWESREHCDPPEFKSGDRLIIITDGLGEFHKNGTMGTWMKSLPEGVFVAIWASVWELTGGLRETPMRWRTEKVAYDGTLNDGREAVLCSGITCLEDIERFMAYADGTLENYPLTEERTTSYTEDLSSYTPEQIADWTEELGHAPTTFDLTETSTHTAYLYANMLVPIGPAIPSATSTANSGFRIRRRANAQRWKDLVKEMNIPNSFTFLESARRSLMGMNYMSSTYQPSEEARFIVKLLASIPLEEYTVDDILRACEVAGFTPEHPQSIAAALCKGFFRRTEGNRFAWKREEWRLAVVHQTRAFHPTVRADFIARPPRPVADRLLGDVNTWATTYLEHCELGIQYDPAALRREKRDEWQAEQQPEVDAERESRKATK